jgi:putative ABC transport system substrate-binding protein
MSARLKRRDFISALGGVAAWPIAGARAQQAAMPVIGFLNAGSSAPFARRLAGFVRGLNELGYIEGRNVAIEYRWAEGNYGRVPALAADLLSRRVALIVATGGDATAKIASNLTTSVPVLIISDDPVRFGIVDSLNRPGANVTGVAVLNSILGAKRVELVRELVPSIQTIGILINPANPGAQFAANDVQAAGNEIGQAIQVIAISSESDFDQALESIREHKIGAVIVTADAFFTSQRDRLLMLIARCSIPGVFFDRDYVVSGGLMSYGADVSDSYRQLGVYAARILNGVKPADLPIVQPTKFELVINLKTARALGFEIPPTLLARADEVIE